MRRRRARQRTFGERVRTTFSLACKFARRLMPGGHPILAANALIASPWFVIAVNVSFIIAVHFKIGGLEVTDLAMSWATMVMDQAIISAGWVIALRGFRWQREVIRLLREIAADVREIREILRRRAT